MPPKKSIPALLKEVKEKYAGLTPEESIQQATRDLEELRVSFEDLKEKHAQAGARMKGSITSRKNVVETKITVLERFLEGYLQPPDPTAPTTVGGAPPSAPAPGGNIPINPNAIDPVPQVEGSSKVVGPPVNATAEGTPIPAPPADSGSAALSTSLPPSTKSMPPDDASVAPNGHAGTSNPESQNVVPQETPTELPPPGQPSPTDTAGSKPHQRPKPRPVPVRQPQVGASPSNPVVLDDIDVKPVIHVDANMDSGVQMNLLTVEQLEAAKRVLELQPSDTSSTLKRRNPAEATGRKKVKLDQQKGRDGGAKRSEGESTKRAKSQKDGAAGTGREKGKGKGKGREEAEPQLDLEVGAVVKTGEGSGVATSSNTALQVVETGIKKVRQRAEKEAKVCWAFITLPAKILDGGEIESSRVRVPVPVDESEQARKEFNQQGWREIHNFTVAGTNISCAVLARAKQFRWFCREIGATSLLLIWSVFINRNKRTRCHFHAITDRASSHNDVDPKISKTSQAAVHIVTGVGLPQDDQLMASPQVLHKWPAFKPKASDHEFAGTRDAAKRIHKSIGSMTAKDLLSFFRVENGRHYLGCGCDLLHATFDFFLWKTSPFLFSDTVTSSVECIGAPWDVRLRPTLVALFSSMGLGPDNLDSVMKYNLRGRKNDLSSAPQFVCDFWKLNQALKASQWTKVGPPSPSPEPERPVPAFVDPDDVEGANGVENLSESDSEDDKLFPRKMKLLMSARSDSEEEDLEEDQGVREELGAWKRLAGRAPGSDGGLRGKEAEAPIGCPVKDLRDPVEEESDTDTDADADADADAEMDINMDDASTNIDVDMDDDGVRNSSPLTSPPMTPVA